MKKQNWLLLLVILLLPAESMIAKRKQKKAIEKSGVKLCTGWRPLY